MEASLRCQLNNFVNLKMDMVCPNFNNTCMLTTLSVKWLDVAGVEPAYSVHFVNKNDWKNIINNKNINIYQS